MTDFSCEICVKGSQSHVSRMSSVQRSSCVLLCPRTRRRFIVLATRVVPPSARMAESPHEIFLRLAKPSASFTHTDSRHAAKLALMVTDFLRQRFRVFTHRAGHEPLAVSYCNDPTPLSMRARYKIADNDGDIVIREGGKSSEWLIQRMWAFNLRGQAAVAFPPPAKMANKRAATHYAGMRQLFDFPVDLGARSVNIAHGVWDRGIYSAMYRLFFQSHAQSLSEATSRMVLGEGKLLNLMSWCVGNGCCDHDCHGALHRAFVDRFSDKLFMKEVYKLFAAVRSGFSILADNVFEWVSVRLVFKDSAMHSESLARVWRTLGMQPDWVDELVDLELRFEECGLCVAARHATSPNLIRRIAKMQLRVWQFRAWTESRWLSIGGRARVMISALHLGLEDLVSFCISTKGASSYHLGGFQPNQDIKEFLLVVGVSSFVSESPLAQMFEDDRLATVVEDIEAELECEQEALCSIPFVVWEALATIAGSTPHLVRHRSLLAGHVQASYLEWRLQDAHRLPWALCRGDMQENLERLAAEPRPDDEGCAAKIWELMRLNVPVKLITDGLLLLSRLSWSSKRVEEGHVQGSRLVQLHKRNGEVGMMLRSQLGQARCLLARPPEEKALDKLEERIKSLKKKNPDKCGGKQVFMGRMVAMAKAKRDIGHLSAAATTQHMVKMHGLKWDSLSPQLQMAWRETALQRRVASRKKIKEELEEAMQKKKYLEEKLKPKIIEGPLTLTKLRFTTSELLEFNNMWDNPRYSQTQVAETVAALSQPMQPASELTLQTLASFPEPVSSATRSPAWAVAICRHREEFWVPGGKRRCCVAGPFALCFGGLHCTWCIL